MKFKEYIQIIIFIAIPIIACICLGAFVINLFFVEDIPRIIAVRVFVIIITYPFTKYIKWASNKF